MRVAVVADIGNPTYHVGDEAIGQATHAELTRRGVHPVMLSHSPDHTRRTYGDVETSPTLEFPWDPVERERYLDRILRLLAGDAAALPPHDPAREVMTTIRTCRAVLVAGGGNLNSTYGWLLSERAALVAIADRLGLPAVVSGQTLGPSLTDADRGLAADLLRACGLVGLRDSRSVDLAVGILGPDSTTPIVPSLDDATFFGEACGAGVSVGPGGGHPIVVTISSDTGPVPAEQAVPALADLLDRVASMLGVPVAFQPHMSVPGAGDADEGMHRRIADQMRAENVILLPAEPAATAAARARRASLVITTRLHPAVFACASGVSVLCLAPDDYTAARMTGVLSRWGIAPELVLPLSCILQDDLLPAVKELWSSREVRSAEAAGLRGCHREFASQWWDAVVAALRGERPAIPVLSTPIHRPAPVVVQDIARRHSWYLPLTADLAYARLERDRAEASAAATRKELDVIARTRAFRTAQWIWATRLRVRRTQVGRRRP